MSSMQNDPRSYGLGVIMGWSEESIDRWLQECEELDSQELPSSPAPTDDDLTDAEFAELVSLDQLPSSSADHSPQEPH